MASSLGILRWIFSMDHGFLSRDPEMDSSLWIIDSSLGILRWIPLKGSCNGFLSMDHEFLSRDPEMDFFLGILRWIPL